MPKYELTEGAAQDLQAIAHYTIQTWGMDQADRYGAQIENHLEAIASDKARARTFLKHRPELLVSRCEHHCVFHLARKGQPPLILAVLHEKMDLMRRLRARLNPK